MPIRRLRRLALILLSLALLPSLAAAAPRAIDDAGARIALPSPARRIVSLAPHATELLFAAGAGDRVVGVAEYSDFPAAAARLPRVGGAGALDLERILALRPDLIVAWQSGNGAEQIERLRELGLTVFVSEPRRLEDIPLTLEKLGELTGTQARAAAVAEAFRRRRDELAARYSDQPPLRVFYQIWNEPLMTVNGEQLISQALNLCGGRNVFAGLGPLAAPVSVEAVLAADPEVIVASGAGGQRPPWLDEWKRWPGLAAVRRGNLYFVPPDLIQRHGPRILDGVELLCRRLEQARGAEPAR